MKMASKKFIVLILTVIFSLALVACSQNHAKKETLTDMLCGVLLGEIPFIDSETNRAAYIYNILDSDKAFSWLSAQSFAIIDLDQDGNDDVVVLLEGAFDEYRLVLHDNDGVAYGYLFSCRAMQDIFTDGSYSVSSGADDSHIIRLSFEDDALIETECNTDISDLDPISSWIDFSEDNILPFLSKKNVDLLKIIESSDILKQEIAYEQACDLVRSGDYSSAIEMLEGMDGYADSDRIISAINAMPYITEIENRIFSDHLHLSLVGIDVYCEYSPVDFTFTEVWEMTDDGLYGQLSQYLSMAANQDVYYSTEGMSSLAEEIYFDYFYPAGIIDIDCAVEVRDSANDVAEYGCFGLGSIPTENMFGYASYEEVEEYASMRGMVIENGELYQYTGNGTTIKIPDGVTKICEYAFWGNETITEIRLPDSITSIDRNAFQDCKNLVTVDFSSSLECIGEYAFDSCDNLSEIEFPKSLKKIGENAFSGCVSIMHLEIPDSVETIDEYAFSECSNLSSVELPNSLNEIDDGVFFNCTALNDITLPESITKIGRYAFRECSALTSIIFPNSLRIVDLEAFNKVGVSTFHIPSSIVQLETDSISGTEFTNLTDIYYDGTIQEWKAIDGITRIDFPDRVTVHCSDGIWDRFDR